MLPTQLIAKMLGHFTLLLLARSAYLSNTEDVFTYTTNKMTWHHVTHARDVMLHVTKQVPIKNGLAYQFGTKQW